MLALVGKSLCEGNGWLQTNYDQRVTCHFATPGRPRRWRRLTEHAPEKKPSPGRPDRPDAGTAATPATTWMTSSPGRIRTCEDQLPVCADRPRRRRILMLASILVVPVSHHRNADRARARWLIYNASAARRSGSIASPAGPQRAVTWPWSTPPRPPNPCSCATACCLPACCSSSASPATPATTSRSEGGVRVSRRALPRAPPGGAASCRPCGADRRGSMAHPQRHRRSGHGP
jgi:hypothetical protein